MSDGKPSTLTADEPLPADSRHARQIARRQLMAEAVMAEGSMRIEDLTSRFGISLMTAHRDLDDLVSRGLLRKTRGVVSAAPESLSESADIYRSTRQAAEKRAIAAEAAMLIEPGQAIFLDDSTTVQQMVPHLAARVPLTVITNSQYWIAPEITVAKSDRSKMRAFGRNWNFAGRSAEICKLDWRGP